MTPNPAPLAQPGLAASLQAIEAWNRRAAPAVVLPAEPIRAALSDLIALYDQRIPLRERPETWEAARAALTAPQPSPAEAPKAAQQAVALMTALDALEKLNQRPRPMCRDCADCDGTCPSSGLPCDMRQCLADARAAVRALAQQAVSEPPVHEDTVLLDWLEKESGEDIDNVEIWACWPAKYDRLRDAIRAARAPAADGAGKQQTKGNSNDN